MLNSKIGEVYIIGIHKENKKRQTIFIEIASKTNNIKYIDLENHDYQNARTLSDHRRSFSKLENMDDIKFVFLVTKKWPENILTNLKNVRYFNKKHKNNKKRLQSLILI